MKKSEEKLLKELAKPYRHSNGLLDGYLKLKDTLPEITAQLEDQRNVIANEIAQVVDNVPGPER